MIRAILTAALLLGAVTTAEAQHRYCSSVNDDGKIHGIYPDLNNERPEYVMIQEWTTSQGEVIRSLMFDGMGVPICSAIDCQRYVEPFNIGAEPMANGQAPIYSCVMR